eukprot:1180561-Prorocentrum_minimum.AAC.2
MTDQSESYLRRHRHGRHKQRHRVGQQPVQRVHLERRAHVQVRVVPAIKRSVTEICILFPGTLELRPGFVTIYSSNGALRIWHDSRATLARLACDSCVTHVQQVSNVVPVYSHDRPIRRRKQRYILTTDQSDAGSKGIFSRRTNQNRTCAAERRRSCPMSREGCDACVTQRAEQVGTKFGKWRLMRRTCAGPGIIPVVNFVDSGVQHGHLVAQPVSTPHASAPSQTHIFPPRTRWHKNAWFARPYRCVAQREVEIEREIEGRTRGIARARHSTL